MTPTNPTPFMVRLYWNGAVGDDFELVAAAVVFKEEMDLLVAEIARRVNHRTEPCVIAWEEWKDGVCVAKPRFRLGGTHGQKRQKIEGASSS